MKSKKPIKECLTGKNREYMPDIGFYLMGFIMWIFDIIGNKSNKNFKTLGLKTGQIVIDYGCGPARYIKNASKAVGDNGKVYAVDIHPIAIKKVESIIKKFKLSNVEAVLANGYSTPIPDQLADVIYALDMFHMIEKPVELLKELKRLIKRDGYIIIEDGHQPRTETINKINEAGLLEIYDECETYIKCKPI